METALPFPHRAFSYMDHYNWDIRFDNIYISTYFCQIDARRKKLVRELNSACQRTPYCAPCGE
jgi:hypothetical protein